MKYILIILLLIGCKKETTPKTVTFEQVGFGDFIIQDGSLVTDFQGVENFKITRGYKGHFYKATGNHVRIYFDNKVVAEGATECSK